LQIEDFELVKKAIQSLFFFVTFLIIMQLLGFDTLLNFNHKDAVVLGTIGNYMILGSYICILAPFLIRVSWLNWIPLILIAFISESTGTVFCIFAGLGVFILGKYGKKLLKSIGGRFVIVFSVCVITLMIGLFAYKTHDLDSAVIKSGRLPVWQRTIKLVNEHPIGYGIATYRLIFPLLSQDLQSSKGANNAVWEYENTKGRGLAWRRAHNCFTQILFETGWIGFPLFMAFVGWIAWRVRKDPLALAGLTIIGMNMMIHFPSRMTQSVFIMIMFLAFCEAKEVAHERH